MSKCTTNGRLLLPGILKVNLRQHCGVCQRGVTVSSLNCDDHTYNSTSVRYNEIQQFVHIINFTKKFCSSDLVSSSSTSRLRRQFCSMCLRKLEFITQAHFQVFCMSQRLSSFSSTNYRGNNAKQNTSFFHLPVFIESNNLASCLSVSEALLFHFEQLIHLSVHSFDSL